jgi:putative membrane protein
MMHDWYTGWGGMGFGPIGMIVSLVLLVGLVVILVRWMGGGQGGASRERTRSPQEILDERFARGEIDHEDYQSRRKALDG